MDSQSTGVSGKVKMVTLPMAKGKIMVRLENLGDKYDLSSNGMFEEMHNTETRYVDLSKLLD